MKTLKTLIVVAVLLPSQILAPRGFAEDDRRGPNTSDEVASPQPVQIPGFHGLADSDAPSEPSTGDDLKLLQGSWELRHGNEGKGAPTLRSVKTIVGNRETLRRYRIPTGEMLTERTTEFKLNQSGPVRVFTFYPVGGEPTSGFSYVYKVNNHEFYDVTGLLRGTEYRDYSDVPTIWRWTRLTEKGGDGADAPAGGTADTRKDALREQVAEGSTVIKDATLIGVDEAGGVISVAIGNGDKTVQLVNVPLAEGVRLVTSHVIPTVRNHLPFEWRNLKQLKGKVVSIRVRASEHGISVVSISERND